MPDFDIPARGSAGGPSGYSDKINSALAAIEDPSTIVLHAYATGTGLDEASGVASALDDVPDGGTLVVPIPSTANYLLEGSSGGGSVLSITKHVRILGVDKLLCKWKFGPDDPSGTLTCLDGTDPDAEGARWVIENMALEGLDSDSGKKICIGILRGVDSGADTSSTVELRRVTMTKFGQCVKLQGDDDNQTVTHTLDVYDSTISSNGLGNGLLIHGDTGASAVRLSGSTFTMSPTTGAAAGAPHNLYLHFPVSLSVNDCWFYDTGSGADGGYNIQWNGGPAATPSYCQIANTRFLGTASGMTGAVLSNPYIALNAESCIFSNSGDSVRIRSDASGASGHRFTNCFFSGVVTCLGGATSSGQATFTNCEFRKQVSRTVNGDTWRFVGCDFRPSANSSNFSNGSGITGRAVFERCEFFLGSLTSAAMLSINNGHKAKVRGCAFHNTSSVRGITVDGASAEIDGSDNDFDDWTNAISVTTNAVSRFRPRTGLGGTVASATEVTFTLAGDTWHLSGTTGTNYFHFQDSTSSAKRTAVVGPLYVICDSTVAFGTSGNLHPRTTSARTANEATCWVSDPAVGTYGDWYEVT